MSETQQYYTMKRKILFSLISGGSSLVMVVVTGALMKFYTDVIGLNPAYYGVVFFIFLVWNAINVPMVGYAADKHPYVKGRGKYRHVIRWAIPVMAFSAVGMLFASPSWSDLVISGYLLALLLIYEVAQAMMQVSFVAFTVNAFINMGERTQVQVIASYVNMIPIFIGGQIPLWLLTGDYSRGTIVAVITATIAFGLLLVWIGSYFVREDPEFYRHVEVTQGLPQLWALGKELFRDRTFRIFVGAFIFIQAGTGSYYNGYLYYMDNVLGVSGLKVAIPDLLTGIVQMIMFPFIIILVRKYGSKETMWRGLLLAVVGHLTLTFSVNYWVAAATYLVILAGYAFSSAIGNPMQGLMVDHLELQSGKRQPGVVRGVLAMFLVPAQYTQQLVLSALLAITGYTASDPHAPETVQAVRWGAGLVPGLILLIGVLLLRRLPVNHTKEREIQSAVEEKHQMAVQLETS
ncbi:MAG: MFS transporter [Actinobacteria bacterium]|nr:MFS transporter [Actinomycetota bacterium]